MSRRPVRFYVPSRHRGDFHVGVAMVAAAAVVLTLLLTGVIKP